MPDRPVDDLGVPDAVVRMHLDADGEAGRAWLEALPWIVRELTARWRLTLGPPFQGGVVAYVAPAERPDGSRVVLKVSFVDDETREEPDALALWDGDGAVKLLDADSSRGGLLLERLEPGTSLVDHPDRHEAISIACALLRRLWRPLPEGHPFPLVGDLAYRWSTELPERFRRLGRPFEEVLVTDAAARCVELAAPRDEPVLANRDYHLGNVLAARRQPWLLIDPKPLAGERAFDTGHLLLSLLPDQLDQPVVDQLIERLGRDLDIEPGRIRAWGFIRSVENALWNLGTGGTDAAWDLACARLLAGL